MGTGLEAAPVAAEAAKGAGEVTAAGLSAESAGAAATMGVNAAVPAATSSLLSQNVIDQTIKGAAGAATSQVIGSLLAPDQPQKKDATQLTGMLTEPTPIPTLPGAIERGRQEQELARRRTLNRQGTQLTDQL